MLVNEPIHLLVPPNREGVCFLNFCARTRDYSKYHGKFHIVLLHLENERVIHMS